MNTTNDRHADFVSFRASRTNATTISLDEPRTVTAQELIAWAQGETSSPRIINVQVREHVNTNDPAKVSVFRR